MNLSSRRIFLGPGEINVSQTRNSKVNGINRLLWLLHNCFEVGARFISPTQHNKRLSAHSNEPCIDVKAERLPVELNNLMNTSQSFNIQFECFRHFPRQSKGMAKNRFQSNLHTLVGRPLSDRRRLPDVLDVFVRRAAIRQEFGRKQHLSKHWRAHRLAQSRASWPHRSKHVHRQQIFLPSKND